MWPGGSRIRNFFLLGAAVLLLVGCRSENAQAPAAAQAAAATPSRQPDLAQPVIEYSEAVPPAEMPSFSLAKPEDEAGEAENLILETAVPPPAQTLPAPTPTPPHLRFTSSEEHYWFWRPIREGETNWTDKVYPYGGTRGGILRPHHGVEFYVPEGTEVLAAADGTVRYAGSDDDLVFGPEPGFYGNLIIIEHDARLDGQPVYTLYAHLSEPLVVEGQHVFMQQIIALSGATGVADGAHLHFEVRLGQNSYSSTRNPLLWLYPFPDRGTVAGRVLNLAGEPLPEVSVTLSPLISTNRSHSTTTYAIGSINSDPLWQENFAIDDVGGGSYQATVQIGETRVTQEIFVQPYRTTFVELIIDPPPPTPTPEPTP